MDDNQGSPTVKSEVLTGGEEVTFNAHQLLTYDYEREIQILERDIRQQKESSVNAKTAITFEQLRKIHNLGKLLGPQKELFFDRICRAADIQRASLKNRLKQNKEVKSLAIVLTLESSLFYVILHVIILLQKFEPPTLTSYRGCYQEPSTPNENASCFMTPHWQQITQLNSANEDFDRKLNYLSPPTLNSLVQVSAIEAPRTPSSSTAELAPVLRPGSVSEDEMKLPAERSLDLMQLGFSFEEVKQIADLFDQYKEIIKPHNPGLTLNQALSQFANLISISVPENLRLLAHTFNLLEMGYTRQEVARLLAKERRRPPMDVTDVDMKSKRIRTNSGTETNGETYVAQETNGNQSDDEVPTS
ncbi:hypothetical protein NECAME_02875 [Necator americanus]|uniref:Uncharacterized protein n=1 Tax=Necator americanus TaxID=51031 RepID=W2T999_NECAM|nr:hypothetical protein NECAME_02875 [Necator americanus]ETN78438.1 hypothetical protein NECAME_02875 [Necator americanus]